MANEEAQSSPRRGFFVSGSVLAGLLTLGTVVVFALGVYQFEFWKSYFYRATVDASRACTASVFGSAPAPITVPHARDALAKLAPAGDAADLAAGVLYRCPVQLAALASVPREPGVVNLHTGWIVGERVEVRIDGASRASFAELGKPVVPLTMEELARDEITVEIAIGGKREAAAGLVGLSPMVLAQGSTVNARVVGVDFALANQKMLYTLLPLLTLGLTMVFGWSIGIRTRMMTVTFFYLFLSMMRTSITMFAEFLPWAFESSFFIQEVLFHGSVLAFIIYGAEMLGLFREIVLRLMGIVAAVTLVAAALTAIFPPGWELLGRIGLVASTLESAAMALVITGGVRRLRAAPAGTAEEAAKRRTTRWVVSLMAFVLFAIWLDYVLTYVAVVTFRVFPQVEKMLPLFVGAILFYTLYLIEQALRDEREARAKMETELNLAAKLQGVLVPKDLEGTAHGFRYEISSKPLGILGGDWVRVFNGKDSALFVLGDVVGKGPSAALTHSGIAASWESQIKLWQKGAVTASELMAAINGTMFDLYQGTMNTTFAFAEVTADGRVRLASGGTYWLHLNPAKSGSVTIAGRSLLGLKSEFQVQFKEISLTQGDWLVCFTDGVLEGNRPISRFLRGVQPEIASLDGRRLRELLVEAGKDQVHPDDASILALKFVGDAAPQPAPPPPPAEDPGDPARSA